MMGQYGRWVTGDTPPDEGYWEALLRDGETGRAVLPRSASGSQASWWTSASLNGSPPPAISPSVSSWEEARRLMEREGRLDLPVTACNRGGVMVEWQDLRGFVPASHLEGLAPFADEAQRHAFLQGLVGQTLELRILELDPEQGRFVLSERATRSDEQQRKDLLNNLCPGDVRRGQVTSLCSFGVFIDLGGLEGLIHISELSWGRVDDPGHILSPGDIIDVYVMNVDRERGRVGLSLKRLQPDPWATAAKRYTVGQVLEGTITHVVSFGAFTQIEEGLEGLIHVSELGNHHVSHPRDAVSVGDVVKVCVLNVDAERRRMGLSLQHVVNASTAGASVHREDRIESLNPAGPARWRSSQLPYAMGTSAEDRA